MLITALFSLLVPAHAGETHPRTLVVSTGARSALVRVRDDGFITVAHCRLARDADAVVTFTAAEARDACRAIPVRLPDTPEHARAFDRGLAALIDQQVEPRNRAAAGWMGSTLTMAYAAGGAVLWLALYDRPASVPKFIATVGAAAAVAALGTTYLALNLEHRHHRVVQRTARGLIDQFSRRCAPVLTVAGPTRVPPRG